MLLELSDHIVYNELTDTAEYWHPQKMQNKQRMGEHVDKNISSWEG